MKVTCVVDDAVCDHSPFWGEHGVAFLIETESGCILFDTGQSGTVLLHNLKLLGVEPEAINALAISHAHYDHTGGLPALLDRGSVGDLRPTGIPLRPTGIPLRPTGIPLRPAGIPLRPTEISLYSHPDLFRERFSRREGSPKSVGLPLDREALEQSLGLQLSAEPTEILPGVWTTGEITDRAEPEGRSPHHLVRGAEGWEPDPYRDDMALVLEAEGGLVVLCGCCHAGLLNTLAHVRRAFGPGITAVAGGTHLLHADEAHLRRVIEVLRELGVPRLYLNHCTGQRAYVTLAQAFGEKVAPCPAGTRLNF
ncbi:MAG: MBL fold metallo-hydrolase [Anaerolineae bacterium]|nr:MBL fold metallo-hydrolase [Anaerolineae bacterium]